MVSRFLPFIGVILLLEFMAHGFYHLKDSPYAFIRSVSVFMTYSTGIFGLLVFMLGVASVFSYMRYSAMHKDDAEDIDKFM